MASRTETRWFSWVDLDGVSYNGIVRMTPTMIEVYRRDTGWTQAGHLYKNFIDPGSGDFEEISETKAEELAKRYGIDLDEPGTAVDDSP